MGEGLICPVQRVSDFLEGMSQEPLPASSYRRGIKSAPLLASPSTDHRRPHRARRWGAPWKASMGTRRCSMVSRRELRLQCRSSD